LFQSGAAVGGVVAVPLFTSGFTARGPALARGLRTTAGTTLEATVALRSAYGYSRLEHRAGEPAIVRDELAPARGGREDRRRGLATIAQLTDLHICDAQHPLRFEYLDGDGQGTGHRPQELLGVHGAIAMVRRLNRLEGGPFTGRPIDVTVTTGDNTDNQSRHELEWALTALAGGWITPDSGIRGVFEGVAASGLTQYWQPGSEVLDLYKQGGFPVVPGLVDAAVAGVRSEGLAMPWLMTMGNHDVVAGGMLGTRPYVDEWAAGDRKIYSASCPEAAALGEMLGHVTASDDAGALLSAVAANADTRPVTPDADRVRVDSAEYVATIHQERHAGAGPVGHGVPAGAAPDELYYAYPVGERVLVVSLDSTNQAGGVPGSVGSRQLAWLDRTLAAHDDRYVVVLSHHPSDEMDNLVPDPRAPREPRHDGRAVADVLHAHPNVVAWVNGHTHHNRITAHGHDEPRRSFWEINTASHIDAPQQARLIEVADNRDGTISLFTTMLDSDAPVAVGYDDLSGPGLASLYRELSFNDPARRNRGGSMGDRNTELLLAASI
jgi:metallophosphoesterase (TIGR03767 family)